jgi:hypothetical protein
MGFRELLYFRVEGCLVEQGVRLTPEQKHEIFAVFRRPGARARHCASSAAKHQRLEAPD